MTRKKQTPAKPIVRTIAERIAAGALEGDAALIGLMQKLEQNLLRMGLGDVAQDYRAKRRKQMN